MNLPRLAVLRGTAILGLLVATATAEHATDSAEHLANRKRAEEKYRDDLVEFRDNPDVLVLPGVLANRRDRWVRVAAETTGLEKGSPVEFILIAQNSSKAYESAAVAFALPHHVQEALEFLGVPPGRPAAVGITSLPTWSKGERIIVEIERGGTDSATGEPGRFRAESLVVNTREGGTMPEDGFVFVRPPGAASGHGKEDPLYAAGGADPGAVIAAYNEPTTVLDVPRRVAQTAAYSSFVPNPQLLLPAYAPLTFVLRPEAPLGRPRVADLKLTVAGGESGAFEDLTYQVEALPGLPLPTGERLADLLAFFGTLTDSGRDPFVRIGFAADLPLSAVTKVCRIIATIDTARGIRVEPPEEGQLFYHAFLPNEEWRDPKRRFVEPLELRLERVDGHLTGTLRFSRRLRAGTRATGPRTRALTVTVDTPAGLLGYAGRRDLANWGLLVFAPAQLPYGELVGLVGPTTVEHPHTFVFLD